jgi:glutamate/tyrosine decarboxylase-like PLP-dependent enzyme
MTTGNLADHRHATPGNPVRNPSGPCTGDFLIMNQAIDSTTIATTERALARAHALTSAFLASLPERPVSHVPSPEEMAAALDEALPETGSDPAGVLDDWFTRAERGITASPGPRFFGFVTGGVTPAALAGDWLASAIDQNAGLWASSPAAAQTELVVLRWLKELFGLPAAWSGALTSGATMANLVGLIAARQWAGRQLGFDASADGLAGHPPILVASSTEIHLSALKCLGTLGFGRNQVRKAPAPGGSVDVAALARLLREIPGPVIIVGNAGEVNSGHFDDLASLADLRDAHPGGAWLHVDAAFGLFASVSPRLAHLNRGIERADSVASDAHKWLNVPYDSGFAFVRDGTILREAFAADGAYVLGSAGWDPYTHVPEMSRRFRGLAAWCTLKAFGREGYRNDRRALHRQRCRLRPLDRGDTRPRVDEPGTAQHRLLSRRSQGLGRRCDRRTKPHGGWRNPGRWPRLRERNDLEWPRRHPRRIRQLANHARRRWPIAGRRRAHQRPGVIL